MTESVDDDDGGDDGDGDSDDGGDDDDNDRRHGRRVGGRATRTPGDGERSRLRLGRLADADDWRGRDDDDAASTTATRSGESRDDGRRAGRWAAARACDGRGGGADDTGGAPGCNEGPALRRHDAAATRLRPRRRVRARGVGVATTTRRGREVDSSIGVSF